MPPHEPSPSLCRSVYAYPRWSASSRDQAYDASHVCLGPHVPHPTPRHATFGRRRSRRLGPRRRQTDVRTSRQEGKAGRRCVCVRVRGSGVRAGPTPSRLAASVGPVYHAWRSLGAEEMAGVRARTGCVVPLRVLLRPRRVQPARAVAGGTKEGRREGARRSSPTAGQGSPAAAARIDDVRGGFNRRHATPVRPGEPILSSKLPAILFCRSSCGLSA